MEELAYTSRFMVTLLVSGQACGNSWNTAKLTTVCYQETVIFFKVEAKKEINLVFPYYKYLSCFREKNTLLCHPDSSVGIGACLQGCSYLGSIPKTSTGEGKD